MGDWEIEVYLESLIPYATVPKREKFQGAVYGSKYGRKKEAYNKEVESKDRKNR